ncbi:MAG: hypothetical protein A2583_05275 [Bdellovibrionales bacterium RIFOXYD1_FULL_53_11]|nr:MAG: hypothetical protein A2583_05275 [Bdellovibrionales bacterium RIFOXYD1_FULL_53_11]
MNSVKTSDPNSRRHKRHICSSCVNFFVSWDAANPWGCKAHGFKSYEPPDVVVARTSGIVCQLFEEKNSLHAPSPQDASRQDDIDPRLRKGNWEFTA